jgi:hypothetical protein
MSSVAIDIEKAFDYRGDVTLTLKDGSQRVGYVFNREAKGSPRCLDPFLEIMMSGVVDKSIVKYSEVASIAFTGEDTAAGKSWEDWMAKETAKKETHTQDLTAST